MMNEIKLPPWSKKRRIVTTGIIVLFILVSAGFIGAGIYQIGVQTGKVKPVFNQESVLQSLMNDAGFYRAVRHSVLQRECVNAQQAFHLSYSAPLHPTSKDCTEFVTTHPTGRTTVVALESKKESRISLVDELTQRFSSVQTEIMSGTAYETSRLDGLVAGVMTRIYVIGINETLSWVVLYSPTSPLVNDNVEDLVISFRLGRK